MPCNLLVTPICELCGGWEAKPVHYDFICCPSIIHFFLSIVMYSYDRAVGVQSVFTKV